MMRTIEVRTELESILIEQALAMARELELVSDAAPDGQVLAVSELAALRAGRELTRVALEVSLNRQSSPAEKKGRLAEPALAADRGRAKTQTSRQTVTAAGRVTLRRRSMLGPGRLSRSPGHSPGRSRGDHLVL